MNLCWIPIAAGIGDALNPCVFAITAAFLIIYQSFEEKRSIVPLVFILLMWVGLTTVNCGVGLLILSSDLTIIILKIIDGFLALVFLRWSYESFSQWKAWQDKKLIQPLFGQLVIGYILKKKFIGWLFLTLLVFILSILSIQWSPNTYYAMLASPAILPERDVLILVLIAIYSLMLLWPVWFTLILYTFKVLIVRLRPLFHAGVFLSASLVFLLILK